LNKIKKYTAPILAILTIFITGSVSPYNNYWFEPLVNINFFRILLFFSLIILISMLGKIMIPNYLGNSLKKFENHIMIKALIENDRYIVIIVFTCTMIFEELIFRGLIFVSLMEFGNLSQELAILANAFIFSLYHLHIWPTFHDKKITLVFMFVSGILGLVCGYFLFYFGYFGAILFHWASVYLIYRNLVIVLRNNQEKK
jgi:hypothetical protein